MTEREAQESRQEAALLDVVRLALNGDQRSLRQRARNLLRSGPNQLLSPDGRRYLQNLLAAGGELSGMRTAPSSEGATRQTPLPGDGVPIPDVSEDAEPPVLEPPAEEKVRRLIREYEHRHLLEEANVAPTTRVLLSGPPGGGKTMTARYIAHELGVPLMLAEPSQVLTGVLGQSARNLSALMRSAAGTPCVLFLDELDAYARTRTETHDIAEPKRLVNTLLLELDRWPTHGLIVGATNHLDAVDDAVRRRFELTIELGYPSRERRLRIIEGALQRAGRTCSYELLEAVAAATSGCSGSDLVNATIAAIRRAIIDDLEMDQALGEQFLSARFIGRGKQSSMVRQQVALSLIRDGWSVDRIAPVLGITPLATTKLIQADA